MKKLLLLSLFFATYASAQSTNDAEKATALKEATLHGEEIFSGILLAQKCEFLDPSEYNSYAGKSYAIVGLLKKVLGKEEVNDMVKRAQVITLTAPFTECGKESKALVDGSKVFVNHTHKILSAK